MIQSLFRKPLLSYAGSIAAIGGFLAFVYLVLQFTRGQVWLDANKPLVLTHAVYLGVLLLLAWLILSWQPKEFMSSPSVRLIRDDLLLICESAPWLGIGVAVSLYVLEEQFEKLAASGEVVNVQSNRLVQIRLTPVAEDLDVTRLREVKEQILIKPGLAK